MGEEQEGTRGGRKCQPSLLLSCCGEDRRLQRPPPSCFQLCPVLPPPNKHPHRPVARQLLVLPLSAPLPHSLTEQHSSFRSLCATGLHWDLESCLRI